MLGDVYAAHDDNPGNIFETVDSIYGTHGLWYGKDEEDTPYVVVGFTLTNATAEIDGDTWGELQGFRIQLPSSYNDVPLP